MLTIEDISTRLRCSRASVSSWIDSGELAAANVAPSGARKRQFRVSEDDLERFLAGRAGGRRVKAAPVVKDYMTPCLVKSFD
jgi:excisionase family DNA binding protein